MNKQSSTPEKTRRAQIKIRDLRPTKDAKGGRGIEIDHKQSSSERPYDFK